jgi:hypothetical protein
MRLLRSCADSSPELSGLRRRKLRKGPARRKPTACKPGFPGWAGQGWLPVAGDGCGNCYVLTADGTISFVDTMKDPGQIDHRAAGDLLSFMIGLLAGDQDPGRTHV